MTLHDAEYVISTSDYNRKEWCDWYLSHTNVSSANYNEALRIWDEIKKRNTKKES